jgi:hypothetical protein
VSLEQFEAPLTIIQQVEVPPQPVIQNVPSAPININVPTLEQTQAVDQVFSHEPERVAVVDFLNLAAVGMLVHDLVKDTLAEPEQEEEEEHPELKPKDSDEP